MPENESLAERLKKVMDEKKVKGTALATKMKVKPSTISNWRSGFSRPNPDEIGMLARLLEVSSSYLIDGSNLPPIRSEQSNVKFISIEDPRKIEFPFVSIKARAGFASTFDGIQINKITETFPISQQDAIDYPDAIVFEIEGDSMEERLKSGDKVLVQRIEPGNWANQYNAVYVIEYDHTITIKRIKNNEIGAGRLTLHPDNTREAGPITITATSIRSIWKVIKIVDTKKI